MKLLPCFRPFGLLEDPNLHNLKLKRELFEKIKTCQKKMHSAEQIYCSNREKVWKLQEEYKRIDFSLAQNDGRLKVVPAFKAPKVEKTPEEKNREKKKLFKLIDGMLREDKENLLNLLRGQI